MIASSNFVKIDRTVHNRKGFDCGVDQLNIFLREQAIRHQGESISRTMVLPSAENESDICAYFTLAITTLERNSLPATLAKRLPRYPVPVILIAQLAVDKHLQGTRLGEFSLYCALQQACLIGEHAPVFAVVVDPLDNSVQGFYERYGFEPLLDIEDRIRMFLPMRNLAQSIPEYLPAV